MKIVESFDDLLRRSFTCEIERRRCDSCGQDVDENARCPDCGEYAGETTERVPLRLW